MKKGNDYNWVLPPAMELARFYFEEHLSTLDLARRFGVTCSAVAKKLKRAGYELRISTECQTGKKSYIRTAEHRAKLSATLRARKVNKGRVLSEEHKKKISASNKWRGIGCNKGKVFSEQWRKNIGAARRGEKAPNWRGGVSFEPYPFSWTRGLKREIKKRDEHKCQICGSRGVVVHHIDYDKGNCNSDNLITLCSKCHGKTNFDRNKWKNILAGIIEGRSNASNQGQDGQHVPE